MKLLDAELGVWRRFYAPSGRREIETLFLRNGAPSNLARSFIGITLLRGNALGAAPVPAQEPARSRLGKGTVSTGKTQHRRRSTAEGLLRELKVLAEGAVRCRRVTDRQQIRV